MEPTGICFICEETLQEGETVCVQKGLENLVAVSKARNDGKHVRLENVTSLTVHKVCRREYIKKRNIDKFVEQESECDREMSSA